MVSNELCGYLYFAWPTMQCSIKQMFLSHRLRLRLRRGHTGTGKDRQDER